MGARNPLGKGLSNRVVVLARLFWAQMALASLVPFQGPKKSRFLGPTPTNAPRNDVAPLKIIMYRAIKTTGTLIVIPGYKTGNELEK
jgi:hypothetical protein